MTERDDGGANRRVVVRGGAALPALGLGTYRMGEDPGRRAQEVAALRRGLELGLGLIDTAEMYADGGAEEVTGEAIEGRRDEVFLVTKILPHNASRRGTRVAVERSLRRLGTDRIDLYLLHWAGPHPLAETLEVFAELAEEGKILHYGLSNFDRDDMVAAAALPGGGAVVADQVLYNLCRRGIEWDLMPWCGEREIAVMAYSPLEEGRLPVRPALAAVARRHGVSAECVALAWTLRQPWVVSIPKTASPHRVSANYRALSLTLSAEDLSALDRDYPPPHGPTPLVIT